MTNNPDKDGWIEWSGGPNSPVPRQKPVYLRLRNGDEFHQLDVRGIRWTHLDGSSDIVAYKLSQPAVAQSLHTAPQPDGFTHESPIRAFTDWQVNGRYAIGKGFRPSLGHLTVYLDAMDRLEGWALLQILEAASGSPSFVFRHAATDESPSNVPFSRRTLTRIRSFLKALAEHPDLTELAADGGVTSGMVFQKEAEGFLLALKDFDR